MSIKSATFQLVETLRRLPIPSTRVLFSLLLPHSFRSLFNSPGSDAGQRSNQTQQPSCALTLGYRTSPFPTGVLPVPPLFFPASDFRTCSFAMGRLISTTLARKPITHSQSTESRGLYEEIPSPSGGDSKVGVPVDPSGASAPRIWKL